MTAKAKHIAKHFHAKDNRFPQMEKTLLDQCSQRVKRNYSWDILQTANTIFIALKASICSRARNNFKKFN